jgi:hypothetical protein
MMAYQSNDKRKSDHTFPQRKKPRQPVLSLEISEDCAEAGELFWPSVFQETIKNEVARFRFEGAASIWQWTTTSVNFGRGPELVVFFAFSGFPKKLEDAIRESFARIINQDADKTCVRPHSDAVYVDDSWNITFQVQDGAVWTESLEDEFDIWVAA